MSLRGSTYIHGIQVQGRYSEEDDGSKLNHTMEKMMSEGILSKQ